MPRCDWCDEVFSQDYLHLNLKNQQVLCWVCDPKGGMPLGSRLWRPRKQRDITSRDLQKIGKVMSKYADLNKQMAENVAIELAEKELKTVHYIQVYRAVMERAETIHEKFKQNYVKAFQLEREKEKEERRLNYKHIRRKKKKKEQLENVLEYEIVAPYLWRGFFRVPRMLRLDEYDQVLR